MGLTTTSERISRQETPDISERLRYVGWGGDAQRGCLSLSFLMRDLMVVGCTEVRRRNLARRFCAARTPCSVP
jgi:hypothetical protein